MCYQNNQIEIISKEESENLKRCETMSNWNGDLSFSHIKAPQLDLEFTYLLHILSIRWYLFYLCHFLFYL